MRIQDLNIYDINSISGNSFIFTSSHVEISNLEASNCSSSKRSPMMSVALESNMTVDGVVFKNSNIALIKILSSEVHMERLSLENIESLFNVLNIYETTNFVLKNSELTSISAENSIPIKIEDSHVQEIQNITILNLNQTPLTFRKSEVNLIDNLSILN